MNCYTRIFRRFAAQMKEFATATGIACLTASASAANIKSAVPVMWMYDKAAAVTYSFDDGYADTFSYAVPYMTSKGVHGTQYVINSFNGITWQGYTTSGTTEGSPIAYASSSD